MFVTGDYEDLKHIAANPGCSFVWLVSHNLCDGPLSYTWQPAVGKALIVNGAKMVFSNDLDLGSASAVYSGEKNGLPWFYRGYANAFDYYSACDTFKEYLDHKCLTWAYEAPIILRDSESAQIKVEVSGNYTGTKCFLSLRCLSIDDPL